MTHLLAHPNSTVDLHSATPPHGSPASASESGVAPRSRHVLLVDPTETRLSWLAEAVGDAHACLTARSIEEAIFLMQAQSTELILAGPEACSTDFLTAVARRGLSRCCVFLASAGEMDRLSEAYAAQHTFHVLSSEQPVDAVRGFVEHLLSPREEARRLLTGVLAELTVADRDPFTSPVLDVSNHGLAVRLGAHQELILAGTRLARVTLYRGNERLLDDVTAVVRHVERLQGDEAAVAEGAAYKLGLELRPPPAAPDGESAVTTEPTRILAALREGLARGPLTLSLADAGRLLAQARRATIDARAREIGVEGATPPDVERGDVVEGRFEWSGSSYTFLSSIVRVDSGAGTFTLRMPRALRSVKQRRSARFHPAEGAPVVVSPLSPFTGRAGPRRAVNVTASGAAFPVSVQDELFPIGARLPLLTLTFPDGVELACRAAVRTLVPGAEPGEALCGVEFVEISRGDQRRIANSIVHARLPELRDGTGTSFDALWDLLLETKFLYPEKLASLDVDALRRTMTRLLGQPNDILKTTVFLADGRLEGHVSGIHTYERTISLQHLAARATSKLAMTRGRLLSLAIIEYLEQMPDIEWMKVWYRPNNRWPATVYGSYADKLADRSLSHHATYGYVVSSTAVPYVASPIVSVRPGAPADHAEVEGHFVAAREDVLLRSDDLTSARLQLSGLARTYGELDLERRRELLVAERDGHFAGFALLEVSSPGLNFSELTNTFRVFATRPDDDATRVALVARARERYRELGYPRAIGLTTGDDGQAFESLGFEKRKDYACWTWHRAQTQDFMRHVRRLGV